MLHYHIHHKQFFPFFFFSFKQFSPLHNFFFPNFSFILSKITHFTISLRLENSRHVTSFKIFSLLFTHFTFLKGKNEENRPLSLPFLWYPARISKTKTLPLISPLYLFVKLFRYKFSFGHTILNKHQSFKICSPIEKSWVPSGISFTLFYSHKPTFLQAKKSSSSLALSTDKNSLIKNLKWKFSWLSSYKDLFEVLL